MTTKDQLRDDLQTAVYAALEGGMKAGEIAAEVDYTVADWLADNPDKEED